MDFIDGLKALSSKIDKQKDMILTEEATKNAFIMPFIALLGYDIFDPSEVIPEYSMDVGIKKGEKADYAIFINNEPIIVFECKKAGSPLVFEQASQLFRYFATNAKTRIGILTNGTLHQFYSDLETPNMMDPHPFLEINMLDIQESLVSELKMIAKNNFNLESILTAASELKYLKKIKSILLEQTTNPSEDFVKFFASQLYQGVKTQKVLQMFTDVIKRAFNQFINERINEKLKSVMTDEPVTEPIKTQESAPTLEQENQIITTQGEIESFYIVKSIAHNLIDIKRIYLKDYKTMCTIIIDNSPSKVIIKLYFNGNKMAIGILDESKKEVKYNITNIQDIYNYAENIKKVIMLLENRPNSDSSIG